MLNNPNILFVNMAKDFGGGEFYTEQLMANLEGFNGYFLGRKSGKLVNHIQKELPHIKIVTLFEAIKLALSDKKLIIHALDGRGVHLSGLFKIFFKTKLVITRQVNFALKRKFSQRTYACADMLVGVSRQITKNLSVINSNATTVYG
ncbi:MAG: glycosyl transferase, partial [Neisseriaceae bacterium]|nr:glycosyl transferase [Neisseriaceae bacterium]